MRRERTVAVAYIARELPVLSETFVVREIAELRRQGVPVTLFSLYRPHGSVRHPELPGAAEEAILLFRPMAPAFWLAHVFFLLFQPLGYLSCLRSCLGGAESWRNKLRSLFHFLGAPLMARCLLHRGIDHVHAHFGNTAATVGMLAARLAHVPFSVMIHAYDLFLDDLLLPEKLENAQFVATCSDFHVRYLQEHYGSAGRNANLHVIHYGIDPNRFCPRSIESGPEPMILGVGRLVETKGFHTLIEACAELKERRRPFRCVLVGSGPEERRLKTLATQLGIDDRMHFVGRLQPSEVAEMYAGASLFAMPACIRRNDRDGMPNVLLEAMSAGIPVVASRVSGIPELVVHGQTGLLVEPDDPGALADAMERLLKDRGLAATLAGSARELIVREFDIRHSCGKLLGLFGESVRQYASRGARGGGAA